MESWLPIPGYEGLYEVSDLGNVRSLGHAVPYGGWMPGRILKQSIRKSDQRRVVTIRRGGIPITTRVSILVLLAFRGAPPDGMEGCHNDGNLSNNKLINLRWDTHRANVLDMYSHGRGGRKYSVKK